MANPHPLNPPHIHLLGRAASQVIVFFARYQLEPTLHLDYVPAHGHCLRVWFRVAPEPAILTTWAALPWLEYFEFEEVSAQPPAYSFSLAVREG